MIQQFIKTLGIRSIIFCLAVLIGNVSIRAQQTVLKPAPPNPPGVFLLDAKQLQTIKRGIREGDKSFAEALAKLVHDAQTALTSGPFSVVSKDAAPPSGDKHDYMSQ